MLDSAGLAAVVRAAEHDIFRMEAQPVYSVPSDGGDYQRYLDGAPGPDMARKAAWHDRLRAEQERGVRRRRVYAAREPLSDYARYEMEWGHRLNADLEDIRILAAGSAPAGVILSDFVVTDSRTVIAMHYGTDGEFTGAEVLPPGELPRYRAARDAAWEAAEPFTAWWDAHPQYHRHVSVA